MIVGLILGIIIFGLIFCKNKWLKILGVCLLVLEFVILKTGRF